MEGNMRYAYWWRWANGREWELWALEFDAWQRPTGTAGPLVPPLSDPEAYDYDPSLQRIEWLMNEREAGRVVDASAEGVLLWVREWPAAVTGGELGPLSDVIRDQLFVTNTTADCYPEVDDSGSPFIEEPFAQRGEAP
jgi:hypothetical protein